MVLYYYLILATPSTEESKALEEYQDIGDNYFAIGPSEQSQQQTPLNPETIERNKNYLKAMDNFQVSWAHLMCTCTSTRHNVCSMMCRSLLIILE